MADIVGTNATEVLDGTSASDTIQGLGGSDQIDGLGGVDTISGGDGADTIFGGNGDDTIYGHSAADLDPNSGHINATVLANVGSGAVFVTGAAGDDGFVYALRKDVGEVVRIDTSTGAKTLFLDIPSAQFAGGGERGVLGLAFHPDYAANGRFFVFLTQPSGDIEVREYARSGGDPTLADPAPVSTIITIPHPTFSNHNGGSLAFGPDGYLHISVGDGGGANDPNGNAQNLDVLLGKILRIDVDGDDFPADASRNYAIPADNPFVGTTPGEDEIWAWGLRNPWRISFDSLTGDLYIGDVGQGSREEVDFESAGGPGGVNYGWDYREGMLPGPSAPPDPPIAFTEPVFDYPRDFGRAITGGYVYHGPAAGLQGAYFFVDFDTGRLMTLRMVDGVTEDAIEHTSQIVGTDLRLTSSFGTDNAGNLYAVSLTGEIYRLDPGSAAGDGADTLDGGAGNDLLVGGQGNDTLIGGPGADSLNGGAGLDRASYAGAGAGLIARLDTPGLNTGDAAGDSYASIENLRGSSFGDTLIGNTGSNELDGAAGNDSLAGGAGNDRLDGGVGADTLAGGVGNDIYVVDQAGDIVSENAGEGNDEVQTILASANLASYANVENLTFAGVAAFTGTGNGGDNRITGGGAGDNLMGQGGHDQLIGLGGADFLDGGSGADRMVGGPGDDTFVVDNVGDKAVENGGGGTDTIQTSIGLAMDASVENVTLAGVAAINATGNGLDNLMIGNSGANELNGFTGVDEMRGGDGDDLYFIDSAGDVVVENVGEGTDTIMSRKSLALGANVENLTLIGTASNGTGNSVANVLLGNALGNTLNGGAGADEMRGGAGNDAYSVDNAGDTVIEGSGNGTDTVSSSVSFTLGAFVENLTLTGAASINGTGNGQANVLLGNSGNNTLSGGTGADEMRGGAGNDTYVVDNVGDVVVEAPGNGTDTVNSAVSFTLGTGLESSVLTGSSAISGTGNGAANSITGNGAANILSGGGGDDDLKGGAGHDDLTGGAGSDSFRFDAALGASTNVDDIFDFSVIGDTIFLDRDIFTGITANGTLTAGAFRAGNAALDADDRIVYDAATGQIFYDADGVGGAAQILFATVTAGIALSNADFVGY